ncbi:MAG: ABC transporter ATP-binding protein [bacterium]
MSNDTIISVEHLSKRYRLGQIGATTLRDSVERLWHRMRGRDPAEHMGVVGAAARSQTAQVAKLSGCQVAKLSESSPSSCNSTTQQPNNLATPSSAPDSTTQQPNNLTTSSLSPDLWALRDVSFEVKRGEVLGIIGRNGAGKSTLLKILSRITEPTSGRAVIRGRVGSLLEVGTGFHPELTGRENIYLNGAILGMRRREITAKFDEIVAFAEVERFIDTPVKRYSSGMYVRLAFAVAAHLDPEILLVDEVLAVGDASFQKKCLGKMGEVAHEGRTILFVSHNMTAIRSLCRSGLLLDHGCLAGIDDSQKIIDLYIGGDNFATVRRTWSSPQDAPGSEDFQFKTVEIMVDEPHRREFLTVKTPFRVAIELWAIGSGSVNISMQLNQAGGGAVFAVGSQAIQVRPGGVSYVCFVPADLLNDGTYTLEVMIVEGGVSRYVLHDALVFEIHDVPREGGWLGKWPGVVRPTMQWECRQTGLNGVL